MSRTKSVVKHRYFKGQQAKRGAGEYTRYVEYREGRDLEKRGREFFTGDRENIKGAEVRELWREQSGRGPVMHELILSPGVNCADNQQYTRELMEKLERTKGQELQWYAVEHKNTDHHHIHVLIAGVDVEGRQVRIDRRDHKHIKEWGDRYIEREHQLDRYLDREMDRLVTGREYSPDRGDALFNSLFGGDHEERERDQAEGYGAIALDKSEPRRAPAKLKEWDKAKAKAELPEREKIHRSDEVFSKYSSLDELKRLEAGLHSKELERVTKPEYAQLKQWIAEKERHGEDYHERKDRAKFDKNERDKQRRKEKKLEDKLQKEREKQKAREAGREFNEFDKRYRQDFQDRSSGAIYRRMGWQQRIYEQRGRLSDAHTGYQLNQDRDRMQAVKDAMEHDPENRERYEKELEWLNEAYREQMKDFERLDLDDLLGGRDRDRDEGRKDKKDKDEKARGEQDREEVKEQPRESEEARTQQEAPATEETEKPDQENKQATEREEREPRERERERNRDEEGRGR